MPIRRPIPFEIFPEPDRFFAKTRHVARCLSIIMTCRGICVTLFDLQRTALWTPRETERKHRSLERARPRKWRSRIWRA
jgi:hypothetical protein